MRTFRQLSLLAALGSAFGLSPALAFDATRGPAYGVAPAASVDVFRRSNPEASLGTQDLQSPPASVRNLSAVEAFRSGAQALRAGDTKSGIISLEYAAASGHPIARWKLGRMYAEGDGVKQDDLRAFEYFRDIADAHADESPGTARARFVANAFVALGTYYLEGIPNSPVKADPDRAREMFTYAASYFGDPDAQYQLGRMYLEGYGGVKDPKQAARWLQLGANKGQHQAQALLGTLLFNGDAGSRQAARGLMWLTLARDAASTQETWIADLHAHAFKQASDEERATALAFIERWIRGNRRE
jgi:exopolysaccharide production negative regulator